MKALIERTGSLEGRRPANTISNQRARRPTGDGSLGMVHAGGPLRRVLDRMRLVAPCRSTVLVTGESGTGKELVARGIHRLSPRKDGPFVALNCAGIPKELADTELFGHCKGAFTGATESRVGKFTAADHGTLLIDEIGEMDLPVQAKLLRTLETRAISPVGSNEERAVDVRIVAATHRDLRALAAEGRFREDLYYRLNVVCIHLPPLAQRPNDIPLLVNTFLEQLNDEHCRRMRTVSADAMHALQTYHWPGNVRELRNLLEGIVVLSCTEVLEMDDLPVEIHNANAPTADCHVRARMTLPELERQAIQDCLVETGGRRQPAAHLLGISVRTLIRKIKGYKLHDPLRTAATCNGKASRSP